ncbi:MAG: carboxypeptidase-like regulatory domain-containing protein [Bacteroidota bacterium]|nr:carboxypeptidase-like regulatory domain-containing protein [Bacteroidota bacterium]
MKQFLFIGGFIIMGLFSNAQLINGNKPQTMKGFVFDKSTNQRIDGAMITFETPQTRMLTMTDAEGYFSISSSSSIGLTLIISMPGYEDKVLKNIQSFSDVEYYIGLESKKVNIDDQAAY